MPDTSSNTPSTRTRRLRLAAGLAVFLVGVMLATPWVIANTSVRDWLFNRIMGTPDLTASTDGASFGWFSPLRVEGVEIDGKLHRFHAEIDTVQTDRPWPRMLASAPDLGAISIDAPHVSLKLPLGKGAERSNSMWPTLAATLNNAALTVEQYGIEGRIIDVDGINLSLDVKESKDGRVLSVRPLQVFQKQDLTRDFCSHLLQLVSPSLGDAAEVQGQFSLSIDNLQIPLEVAGDELPERVEIEGELTLHEVSMQTESGLLQALAKLIADIHEKEPPGITRVVKDSSIRFWAHKGRLFHNGLQLGFPDIDPALQIRSSGSVGLDQTLDLHLEVPRLDAEKMKERGPIRCRVTGTVSKPVLAIKDASLVVRIPDYPVPLIDVDGVDLTVRVEETPSGRMIYVEPCQILQHEKLTKKLASSLVQLFDPEIRYSPQVSGEVSMSVDKIRIPLAMAEDQWQSGLEIHGVLVIHEATSQANTPTRQALIKLIADLYDKEPMELVHISHENEIEFELRQNRLYYSGLRIGIPEIDPNLQISGYGSVGFDESLDMHLEIPRLEGTQIQQHQPVQCHITGTVHEPQFSIKDASLVVQLPDRPGPLIDVDGIDLNVHVEHDAVGSFISVAPVELIRRKRVTRKLASGLLRLVEPELSYSPEIDGDMSLSVDRLRIPIDLPEQQWLKAVEVHGKLAIHEATSTATSPLRRAIIKLLADLYGKEFKEVNEIAHDAEVDFELRDGRLHYSGLTIGFPDIDPALQVSSRGSVGLDQTLDLHLDLPRLDAAKLNERGPVHCHVTGTVKNPDISVKDASLVIRLPEHDQPILDVDAIDLDIRMETMDDIPVLTTAPFQVFDRQRLSAELNDELLGLIMPTLDDVADVEGEVSLTIDSLRMPLEASKAEFVAGIDLRGSLQLYDVTTEVETPLLRAMIKILADLYDQEPTDVVRVVKNADVRFEVKEGRLHHAGMEFGFPDISPELVARSSGTVGLDRSLDLLLQVPAVLAKVGGTRNPENSDYVRFKVTGTIDSPIVKESDEN